jgi:hypothetical protein
VPGRTSLEEGEVVSRKATFLIWALLVSGVSTSLSAAPPACRPCVGIATGDTSDLIEALAAEPGLTERSVLFVRLETSKRRIPEGDIARIVTSRAVPWITFEIETPAPLFDNLGDLDLELEALVRVARLAGARAYVQIQWSGADDVAEYAFLLKRAAAAVGGSQPDAQLLAGPLPEDDRFLGELYAAEVAAYVDGITVPAARLDRIPDLRSQLDELDPGAFIVVTVVPVPDEPSGILVEAARASEAGANVALFSAAPLSPGLVQTLTLLAREFSGDLSLDPYSRPTGASRAWSFVRGDDLSLRVIAERLASSEELELRFEDPGLRDPALLDPGSGEAIPQWGLRRSSEGLELSVVASEPVVVVSLQRMTAEELEGIEGLEEEVTVEDTRQMPVEEILRRLQAFEDAQARRIENYRAINTTHLRFQGGTGAQSVEVTFEGGYFYQRNEGFDWAWESLLINGIEWRDETIPEIPLFEPEKAAALPVEITFSKEYRYSLRGMESVEGRDCWIVDFEPAVAVEPGRTLFRGTVWVDREIYARVRTRAVQLGLEGGEVLSNEETTTFSPVDAGGAPAPWSPDSFFLPLRLVGQQLWSILSATAVVEREILLTDVVINESDFDERRRQAYDSEVTMVRDTAKGLRYLVKDEESGARVPKDGFDTKKRFVVGGVFYDESQDFPVPLAGFNWLWFDWRGTGAQANVFFAGPLISVAFSDPSFRGTKFDVGFDVFAFALRGSDTYFRDGVEAVEEEVESTNPNIDFKLGRPIGNFFKVDLRYQLGYRTFGRADDTADEFVMPRNHLNHELSLAGRYTRRGYRARLAGQYNLRGDWEPWGLPGNDDFDPGHEEYVTWQVGLGKTWHLPKFLKFGAEIEYASGNDLDRFSKYEFGSFSDIRVRGYQSSKVRAEEVLAAHLTYGFDIGNVFRLDLVGDAAWATDDSTGLDRELLGGVGVVGTVLGPWQTIINLDLGVAVTGPDDGVTATVAFLKLFD